jgi:transcriptional regulator with XRE-family HTH domain
MDTSIDIYGYVMAHLRAKRIPQRQVATESGVPFSTVSKIAHGSVKEPSVHTVQRLFDYFSAKESATGAVAGDAERICHGSCCGRRRKIGKN